MAINLSQNAPSEGRVPRGFQRGLEGEEEWNPTNQFGNANSELNRNIKGRKPASQQQQQQQPVNNQKLIKNNKCSLLSELAKRGWWRGREG